MSFLSGGVDTLFSMKSNKKYCEEHRVVQINSCPIYVGTVNGPTSITRVGVLKFGGGGYKKTVHFLCKCSCKKKTVNIGVLKM